MSSCLECVHYRNCKRRMADPFRDDDICKEFFNPDERVTPRRENQSAKADAGKPKLTLVPRTIIRAIAAIREYGNNKYPEGGPDNWKEVGVDRYRDAAFRHFLAYLDDPHGLDEESGLPHLWHHACNIAFLCDLEAEDIYKVLIEKRRNEDGR